MSYSVFNTQSWSRKNAFNFYKDFDDPFFNVTVNLSVEIALQHSKASGSSFFLYCLHRALLAANSIENFKLRMLNDEVRHYEVINGGSTILFDDESFGFAYYSFNSSSKEFVRNAIIQIDDLKKTKTFDPSNKNLDLIYFSSLPWLTFTSIKHAQDKRVNPSIPKISFGKYTTFEEKTIMPVNVEVHHSLMDGYHVAQFFDRFQSNLNDA